MDVDAAWAFARYEAIRPALPTARFPGASKSVARLSEVAAGYGTVLLDAFGVLNIGAGAISAGPAFVAGLRAAGARVGVVSNSASVPTAATRAKFRAMGYDFAPDEIVTSRDALKEALAAEGPRLWGVMAAPDSVVEELGIDARMLGEDARDYDSADGFVLLGSAGWTEARQAMLSGSLARDPRPVLVGNPDLVAPRETGLSLEPGHFAHDLAARTGCVPVFHGKPFPSVFDLAARRLGPFDPARTLMVGDTLHTDVLGGAAMGYDTCLLTDYGLFRDMDVAPSIERSGIRPDIVAARL